MADCKRKIIRITTVPQSMRSLLKGQLRFMMQYYTVVAVTSDGEDYANMINEQGVRGVKINMTRRITPLRDLYALFQLIKLFIKEKPYIVHTHTPKAGTLGMIAAYLTRVPHRIHTVAGLPLLEATGKKRKLLDFVEKITYKCATRVLPNSFALKDIILRNKLVSAEKIDVIGNGSSNGIDTSYFCSESVCKSKEQLRSECNIHKDDFVFIFVGRIVKDKGINELISAFKIVSAKYSKAKLLLVGPYEKELDPIALESEQEIETSSSIISVGFQNYVLPYFKMADALVFPSYREGFPNVVMQAGAMGLPSIVTDINGCNEIIIERENGLIIPSKSVSKLIKAMEEFIVNSKLVGNLQLSARKLICNRYEQKDVWNAILKMYQDLDNSN